MSEYVFPAIFEKNLDGSFSITFPDLQGCISEGKSLENALYMAQSALTQWIKFLIDNDETIPTSSDLKNITVKSNEFVNLVRADIRNTSAVKRTVSLPEWLDNLADKSGLSLSKVLQDALKQRLNVE